MAPPTARALRLAPRPTIAALFGLMREHIGRDEDLLEAG